MAEQQPALTSRSISWGEDNSCSDVSVTSENMAVDATESLLQYQPLSMEKQQIRLFRVLSKRSQSGAISCTMENFDMDEAPPYEAVSYAWGPPKPVMNIEVNGQLLAIRKNLYDFLDTHEWRLHGSYVWADQICINQRAITERNHQVQIMERIFRQAGVVTAWLGESANASQEKQLITAMGEHKVEDIEFLWSIFFPFEDGRHIYFTRLWVVQEVHVAQQLRFYYGSVCVPNRVFEDTSGENDYVHFIADRGSGDWGNAMFMTRGKDCSELRDHVYAVQILLPDYMRLPVDYGKDLMELFFDAAAVYEKSIQLHDDDAVYEEGIEVGEAGVFIYVMGMAMLAFRLHIIRGEMIFDLFEAGVHRYRGEWRIEFTAGLETLMRNIQTARESWTPQTRSESRRADLKDIFEKHLLNDEAECAVCFGGSNVDFPPRLCFYSPLRKPQKEHQILET